MTAFKPNACPRAQQQWPCSQLSDYNGPGVTLPFGDLPQLMPNVTQMCAASPRISARTCEAKMMELTKVRSGQTKTVKSVHARKSRNMQFKKSLNRSGHRMRHHFPKTNNSRHVGEPSSLVYRRIWQ